MRVAKPRAQDIVRVGVPWAQESPKTGYCVLEGATGMPSARHGRAKEPFRQETHNCLTKI